ncbi:MAG: AtzE family amidohydrolase [Novosphingobium sp.]
MSMPWTASQIVAEVHEGAMTAEAAVARSLAAIAERDPQLNCFTKVLGDEALADARALDADPERLQAAPLAGVPFAVKDLFDIEGQTTRAGSAIHASRPAATRDATLVDRLRQAGAILLGSLNMDEFAYGFSTENAHYGATRNPHDPQRIAGGSSGGSASAVAARMVPLSLGSDTNGSIRVPAALCGVYGLKPTYGGLSKAGTTQFVASLDHVGHFTLTADDLLLAYGCMAGHDSRDPTRLRTCDSIARCADLGRLRVGILGGWFRQGAIDEAIEATEKVAAGFAHVRATKLDQSDRARSAAYCITAAEAGNLHLPSLRSQAAGFDPATRNRLIAGALLPASIYLEAQRFRTVYRKIAMELFEQFDVLLAPSTPCAAPRIGQSHFEVAGEQVLVRPNLGIFTQPISFIGLPVVSVPVCLPGKLPLGVQLIGRPGSDRNLLTIASALEREGCCGALTLEELE